MRLVGYIPNRGDKRTVTNAIDDIVARYEDDMEPRLSYAYKLSDFDKAVEEVGGVDICCSDTEPLDVLKMIRKARAEYPEMLLLLIAEQSLSPTTYIRPDVVPTSLLIRPINESVVRKSVNELMKVLLMRMRRAESNLGKFVIDTKYNKQMFDHADILFFEARDKRLYLNTAKEAVPFYSTLDKLQGELPSMYVRCHKSFIVNTWCIKNVNFSDGLIELSSGIVIPVSRSCKAELRSLRGRGEDV